MDFSCLPEGTIIYSCKICDSCWKNPDDVTLHLKSEHAFSSEDEALQSVVTLIVEKNEPRETPPPPEQKLWTREATLLLIDLVGEFEQKFQNAVKKYIWLKICDLINSKLKTKFVWLQCDTKWKSLNKMYKDIKAHNNTSGKERKKWEYFEKMDSILYCKPEITPPATCSSSEGLKINGISATESSNKNYLSSQPSTSGCSKIESTMSKKRKQHASETERRHREKLAKQDEFLNQFKKLIDILERNKKPENENVDKLK